MGNSWNLCFNENSYEEDYSLTQMNSTSDIYLANGGVYKSIDDVTIWNQIYTSSFGSDIIDIVVDQNNINYIYSYYYNDYHNRKIFFSSDGGSSWQDASYGLSSSVSDVYDLSISNSGKVYLLADNGFWSGYPIITNVDDDLLKLGFYLSENYPNPFNNSSVIRYSIPYSSQVSLKIFNVLGSEIETLVNEEKSVGTYQVNLNATNLASGVYIYKIQAGSFINSKKMILLK